VESSTTIRDDWPESRDRLGDFLDSGGTGKAGHDDRRAACDRTNVSCDRDIGKCKLGAPRGVDIVADHLPSALDEIAGDRAAHDAKTNDTNRLVHEIS
jgi:hypothetical protein